MSVCPTCGKSQTSAGTVLAWCLGIFFAGTIGLFMFIIVCLAAISSIGESSNQEFEEIAAELQANQANIAIEKSFEQN
ncbi:MAG: hypothetical protein AAF483_01785 [Planctomycetota bacterium]